MVASLLRVLHSGPQDLRLLPKSPIDVSAFIRVLVRPGRMTTQWARLDFQQKPEFGQTAYCNLLRKGELITRLYLVANLPDIYGPQKAAQDAVGQANFRGPYFGWTNSLGHALINQTTLDIGGTRVETIPSRLLEVLDEFNTPLEKLPGLNTMIQRLDNGFGETSLGNSTTPTKVIVPLPFWFSRGDLGAALPIDAIHVDEVRVGVQFRPVTGLYYTDSRLPLDAVVPSIEGSALWPMLGSRFYKADPEGIIEPGLYHNKEFTGFNVSPIEGFTMPTGFSLGDTYLLAEYIYLDKPEANRFRLADIELPVPQHYTIDPRDTQLFKQVQIPIEVSNPVRHLYWMAQNYLASAYNAHFLATRDLSGNSEPYEPWWPDAIGLSSSQALPLVPGFATRGSEPFTSIALVYEGSYVKTSTENTALYRSILPSLEERKSPWVNRYMYCMPFGVQAGYFPPSVPTGEANFNRIMKKELQFGVQQKRMWIYVWLETYNVLRIYGGRAALLFAY